MKRFIVVTEVYERYGSGNLILRLLEAEDLDALIRVQLEPSGQGYVAAEEPIDEDDDSPYGGLTPSQWLREANGDGMNYYLIKELLPDGTLSDDLTEWVDQKVIK